MKIYDSNELDQNSFSSITALVKQYQLLILVTRMELHSKYRKSYLGIFWNLLNPLFISGVLFFVFNRAYQENISTDSNFIWYVLTGVLLSNCVSEAIYKSAESISHNQGLFTKIYVSPYIFSAAVNLSLIFSMIIGLMPLLAVIAIRNFYALQHIWLLPATFLFIFLLCYAIGNILSLPFVRYHDTRPMAKISLGFLTYVSPVFYPISMLGPHTRFVINLNPVTSLLCWIRFSLGINGSISTFQIIYPVFFTAIILLTGTKLVNQKWPHLVAQM